MLRNSAKGTEDGQEQEHAHAHAHDDLDAKPRGQPRDLDRFADTAGANGVALPTVDRAVDQQLLGEPEGVYVLAGSEGAREARRRCANSPMHPGGTGSSIQVGSSGSRACTILVA